MSLLDSGLFCFVLFRLHTIPLNLEIVFKRKRKGLLHSSRSSSPPLGQFCGVKQTRYSLSPGHSILAPNTDCASVTKCPSIDNFHKQWWIFIKLVADDICTPYSAPHYTIPLDTTEMGNGSFRPSYSSPRKKETPSPTSPHLVHLGGFWMPIFLFLRTTETCDQSPHPRSVRLKQ